MENFVPWSEYWVQKKNYDKLERKLDSSKPEFVSKGIPIDLSSYKDTSNSDRDNLLGTQSPRPIKKGKLVIGVLIGIASLGIAFCFKRYRKFMQDAMGQQIDDRIDEVASRDLTSIDEFGKPSGEDIDL